MSRPSAAVLAARSMMLWRASWRIANSFRARRCAHSRPSLPRSAAPGMRSAAPSGTDALLLGADGVGDRAGRRGDLPVLHLSRHRGDGGAAWRDADHRRCRAGHVQSRPGKLRAGGRDGEASADLSRARSSRSICSACRPITTPSTRSPRRTGSWCSTTRRRRFGATYRGRKLGALATATATSFFPAKPLGCYGDGGAVFTDDDALAGAREKPARARRGRRQIRRRAHRHHRPARYHPGGGADRKAENLSRRDRRAQSGGGALFRRRLPTSRRCRASATNRPRCGRNTRSALAPGRRDALAAALKAEGIPTAIYYAKPLHRQPAYRDFPIADGGVPVSEQLSRKSSACRCTPISSRRCRTASSMRSGGRSRAKARSAHSRASGNPDLISACWAPRFRGDVRIVVPNRR